VKVESGEAEVTGEGKTVDATAGYAVPFDGKLTARKLLNDPAGNSASPRDALDTWSEARNNSVDQGNQDAAATADLSGVIDGWNNNPDAVLQSLGIPPYIPGMSSMVPPPGYGSSGYGAYGYGSGAYGSGLYGPGVYGSGLYGSPLYFSALYPYSLYGLGPVNPLLVYGMPLYRPYRYGSYYPSYTYRGSTPPGRAGAGYGYSPTRSYGTVRPGIGVGVGRVGAGGIHAGGHR